VEPKPRCSAAYIKIRTCRLISQKIKLLDKERTGMKRNASGRGKTKRQTSSSTRVRGEKVPSSKRGFNVGKI